MGSRGSFLYPPMPLKANHSHQGIAVFLGFLSHRTEAHRGIRDFQVAEGDAQVHAVLFHQPLFQKAMFLAVQCNGPSVALEHASFIALCVLKISDLLQFVVTKFPGYCTLIEKKS